MTGVPAERLTPKRARLAHIVELRRKPPRQRMTLADLQKWHRHAHHDFRCNHVHAGVDLGPGGRPPGWNTGADAVRRTDRVRAKDLPPGEVERWLRDRP